jgi:hypothetical protein
MNKENDDLSCSKERGKTACFEERMQVTWLW